MKYPDNWAVLLDKEYQGAQQYIRSIIPKKKSWELLPLEDKKFHSTVTSNRIIVECFWLPHKI